jgi:hypothetical protein
MAPRALPLLLLPFLLSGSCQKQERKATNFEMGEKIELGPFNYTVVESAWRNQLGEGFAVRSPQNRFLLISISVTNQGSEEAAVPLLSVEGANGQLYQELSDGAGVTNWLGLLRLLQPAQTLQGRLVFDVPLGSYRLRLPDGGRTGYEKYAWVEIPLRLDSEPVHTPLPGMGN